MAWTTIEGNNSNIDDKMSSFQATVSSIDGYEVAGLGANRMIALVEYTA